MRIAGCPAQYSLLGAVCLNSIVKLSSRIALLRASVWISTFHRHGGRQAEVVSGGETIDQHADLVASGEGDDVSLVGDGRSLRQSIDPRSVV